MKPTANKIVLQITETVLRVNTQGRWHGFIHFSGHTEQIEVYFHPVSTNNQEPAEQRVRRPRLAQRRRQHHHALRPALGPCSRRLHLASPGHHIVHVSR